MRTKERIYLIVVVVIVVSSMSTCYLNPPNQSAPDAYLPLLFMWSWLSLVGVVGVVPMVLGSRARRAVNILLATMICTVASQIFDYWIVAVLLRRDFTRTNELMELVGNMLYVLLVVSSLAAPAALLTALAARRSMRSAT